MSDPRRIGVGEDGLTAAERSLTRRVADLERQLGEEVDRRDAAEEWADKLAHAIAGAEDIGEHSNVNSPWANALAIAEARGVAAGPQAIPEVGAARRSAGRAATTARSRGAGSTRPARS